MKNNFVFGPPVVTESQKTLNLPTTLAVLTNYFKFLKVCGLFPFDIQNETMEVNRACGVLPPPPGGEGATKVIKTSKNPAWRYANLVALLFLGLHFLFQFAQFIRISSGKHSSTVGTGTILGTLSWLFTSFSSFVFAACFWYKGSNYAEFLNSWSTIEREILTQNASRNWPAVARSIASRNRWYRGIMASLLCNEVLIIAFAALTHYKNPLLPGFVFSLVGRQNCSTVAVEITYFASMMIQVLSAAFNATILTHFEVLCMTVALSVRNCLNVIGPRSQHSPDQAESGLLGLRKAQIPNFTTGIPQTVVSKSATFGEVNSAICNYICLQQDLVRVFNSIFKWMLFTYKAIMMCQLCFNIYFAVRFATNTSGANDAQPQLDLLLVLVFITGTARIIFKLQLVLFPMGSVKEKADKFANNWIRELWKLRNQSSKLSICNDEEFKLIRKNLKDNCIPTGFQVGCFYTVQKLTILTYFSITATYLIVLLQI